MDSYNDILDKMTSKYKTLTSATLSDESDIMLRMKILAGELHNLSAMADFIKRQLFVQTAQGEYLDSHAQQRGLTRKAATKATGKVTFYTIAPAATDIVIDAGTIVGTPAPNAKRFQTDELCIIPQGKTEVTVGVTATKPGADHNVLINTVTVPVTPPIGVSSVKNKTIFSNGTDEETDEMLRERLLESYRDVSNGTNAEYYKRLAMSVPGVYSAGVIPKQRGVGTVDVYICAQGENATPKLIAETQSLLDKQRELCVDINVQSATELYISYTFNLSVNDGYSFSEVAQRTEDNIRQYIDSLGIGKAVMLADIGDIIYHTEGVKNYSFLSAFCNDCYVHDSEYCTANMINIRQVS